MIKTNYLPKQVNYKKIYEIGIFLTAVVFVSIIMKLGIATLTTEPPIDWHIFQNSPIFSSPYTYYGFLNPYWLKFIIAPLMLLPTDMSYYIFISLSIFAIVYLLKGDIKLIALIFSSPYFISVLVDGQIDQLVMIGYILMKQGNIWGIPLVLIKPQIVLGSVITLFVHATSDNKLKIVAMGIALLAVGFLLYGNWVYDMYSNITSDQLFMPVSINDKFHYPIIGIVLFGIGLWRNNLFLSGIALLFATPYIAPHSLWVYWGAFLLEKPNKYLVTAVLLATWIVSIFFMN